MVTVIILNDNDNNPTFSVSNPEFSVSWEEGAFVGQIQVSE